MEKPAYANQDYTSLIRVGFISKHKCIAEKTFLGSRERNFISKYKAPEANRWPKEEVCLSEE